MIDLVLFYSAAALSVITTIFVLGSRNPIYAVIYLIMSLFGISVVLYLLGAAFLAMLEIVIYAGAIMVLFLFVVMMLNLGAKPSEDLARPSRKQLLIPATLAIVLLVEVTIVIVKATALPSQPFSLSPAMLGIALYKKHYLGVELASIILLIGIIGGIHLGRAASVPESVEVETDVAR